MRYEPQKGKKADKKLTHLSLMEPKMVGNTDSKAMRGTGQAASDSSESRWRPREASSITIRTAPASSETIERG
jgi:hypothetical protein